ncbi:hypothetical protein R4483_07395 [Acinetobacter baumannii]|uniref:hypothetical protein n=1 Tax=Acinetobacter calcoaceticus/baumannii complex TaxID=909768 RepID=UPI000838DCB9|nr:MULTISPECIES: hypothetical protein [Acinetobacter calcoaceticus/baumannii complex]HCC93127.1 hypothetical protein [Flavobacteriaceae bacterium]MDH2526538.1 hypothetical protein [Acinetobacter baumannii]MDV7432889.1 hypothetical protein [Acinetobacter baumannii]MDV8152261.1 hypothetical protein [Acinetobacter pittii]OCY52361.1 hypothetical protein BFR81_08885 [Acinetobacter pittii]
MKKWKRVVLWIVYVLVLLAVIVGGGGIYLVQKHKKEEALVNSAYKKLIPDDIDSYSELKNYYYKLYLQGLIEENVSISPYEDPTIPTKISIIQGNCYGQFLKLNYSELQSGLKSFDQEIDFEGYDLLNGVMVKFKEIPPIANTLALYGTDKKISRKELCTLANMYEQGKEYENKLIQEARKNSIKANL